MKKLLIIGLLVLIILISGCVNNQKILFSFEDSVGGICWIEKAIPINKTFDNSQFNYDNLNFITKEIIQKDDGFLVNVTICTGYHDDIVADYEIKGTKITLKFQKARDEHSLWSNSMYRYLVYNFSNIDSTKYTIGVD